MNSTELGVSFIFALVAIFAFTRYRDFVIFKRALRFVLLTSYFCAAQTSSRPAANTATPQPQTPAPFPTQIKKTVAFLTSLCLHDFDTDMLSLKQQLPQMPPQQQVGALQQLITWTSRLSQIPQAAAKLTPDEKARLNRAANLTDTTSLRDEIVWRADILPKMASFSADELRTLSEQYLPLLPSDEHLGTAFFVAVPDERLKPKDGPAPPDRISGFTYLITNRHVIQPGVDSGRPCQVIQTRVMLNRKPDASHTAPYAETLVLPRLEQWRFSDDDSVDLAAIQLGIPDIYDFIVISTEHFVRDDEITKNVVVEGDPVIFTGLFIQNFTKYHRLEPIVRSGTLAMIPEGPVETTMNKKQGRLLFTEAHAFGGNSGSPIFVDSNHFSGTRILGPSYKLLGVVSGEVLESADLSFNVTTTISGSIGANSDISTVVPSGELLKILQSERLKAERDALVVKMQQTSSSPQPVPPPKK